MTHGDFILSLMPLSTKSVIGLCALCFSALAIAAEGADSKPPKALPGAHAHNDYYHKRPLWDALERGFASIEADVFLVDGRLLVGHYRHELRPERTLESLYLEPLRKHVQAHGGRVFAGGERLTLLVDFKTQGLAAYAVLNELLGNYEELVSTANDEADAGPVQVVVTGDRPMEAIRHDAKRRLVLDGRLGDLELDLPVDVMPLVSESWTSHFTWRGQGKMPDAERQRLREMVARVHEAGHALRFWATPDDPAMWKELQAAGVDLIGADDLEALREFLGRRAD